MSVSKNNLKFEYLYRNASNYKEFGQLIFTNPNNLDSGKATSILKSKLIDKEYFYPTKVSVSKFNKCDYEFEMEWYEFIQISSTEENPTENINIESFISTFNTK